MNPVPEDLRVLMVSWEYTPWYTGGTGTACRGMTGALGKMGIKVFIWLPWSGTVFEPDDSGAIGRDESTLDITGYPGYGVYDVNFYLPYIGGYIPECNFDLIHCHDWPTIQAALQLQKRCKKPLVFHLHSLESDRAPGTGNPEIAAREREGCQKADMVIAVSKYTAKKITEEYAIPQAKIRVLYNGYELEDTKCPAPRYNPWGKAVLFLGRLADQKGPDIFLEAALRLSVARSDTVFIIAGSGPMEQGLWEAARTSRAGERIIFTGFIPHWELTSLLEGVDMVVMPSLSEPFGITGLEAMSLGLTVIVTATAGLTEVVKNIVALDRPEPADLACLLSELLDTPGEIKRIGRAAAREAADLGWNIRGKELVALYQELHFKPR